MYAILILTLFGNVGIPLKSKSLYKGLVALDGGNASSSVLFPLSGSGCCGAYGGGGS